MSLNIIKKGLLLLVAGLCFSSFYVNPSMAEGTPFGNTGEDYLKVIAQNTTSILTQVNMLPNYINTMVQYAVNMQKSDDTSSTSEMQANFANLGVQLSKDLTLQQSLQTQITADLFGQGIKPPVNQNDLVYSSMLAAYDPNNQNSKAVLNAAYNYMRNVAGLSLLIQRPNPMVQNYAANVYENYFNTIMSVRSYNAYILSGRLAEMLNGNSLSPTQTALVAQASNSDRIAQVATEEIGKVLRQMLMFQAQTYVLLSDMMQTQKQLLMSQVMTNTLLMASNRLTEEQIYAKTQKA